VFRYEEKVVRNDGELVENEVVGGVLGRELGDQEIWGWILKGIGLWGLRTIVGLKVGGLLREGRAIAELVLLSVRAVYPGVMRSLTDIPAALMIDRWVWEKTR
jgi:hypothetical protein